MPRGLAGWGQGSLKSGKVVVIDLGGLVGLIVLGEFVDVEEADGEGGFFGVGCGEEFIFEEDAVLSAAGVEVFKFEESFEMAADLGLAPSGVVTELTTGEEAEGLFDLVFGHAPFNEGLDVL